MSSPGFDPTDGVAQDHSIDSPVCSYMDKETQALFARLEEVNKKTFELLERCKKNRAKTTESSATKLKTKTTPIKKKSTLPEESLSLIKRFVKNITRDEIEEIITGVNSLIRLFAPKLVDIVALDIMTHKISDKELKTKLERRLIALAENRCKKSAYDKTPFTHAIKLGLHVLTKFMINLGMNPNDKCDSKGMSFLKTKQTPTYLEVAAKCYFDHPSEDGLKTIKILLENGADPNLTFTNGLSFIELACKHHDTLLSKLLIDHGASVDVSNICPGKSLLEVLLEDGSDQAELSLLVAENTTKPNETTLNGQPIVIDAARKGMTDVVNALLEKGADPNALSIDNETLGYILFETTQYDALDHLTGVPGFKFGLTLHQICANDGIDHFLEFIEEYGEFCDLDYRTHDYLTPMERIANVPQMAPMIYTLLHDHKKATNILIKKLKESAEVDRRQNFYSHLLPLQFLAGLQNPETREVLIQDIDLLLEEQLMMLGSIISTSHDELRTLVLKRLESASPETLLKILPHLSDEIKVPFFEKVKARLEELAGKRSLTLIASEIRALSSEIEQKTTSNIELLRRKTAELKGKLFEIKRMIGPFEQHPEILNVKDAAYFVNVQMLKLAEIEQKIPKEEIADEDIDAFTYLSRFCKNSFDPQKYVEIFELSDISDISVQGLSSLSDLLFIISGIEDEDKKLAAIISYLKGSKMTWSLNQDMTKDLKELIEYVKDKTGHHLSSDELLSLDAFILEHQLDLKEFFQA